MSRRHSQSLFIDPLTKTKTHIYQAADALSKAESMDMDSIDYKLTLHRVINNIVTAISELTEKTWTFEHEARQMEEDSIRVKMLKTLSNSSQELVCTGCGETSNSMSGEGDQVFCPCCDPNTNVQ